MCIEASIWPLFWFHGLLTEITTKSTCNLPVGSFCLRVACTVEVFFLPVLASHPKARIAYLQHAAFLDDIQDTGDLGIGNL